MCFLLDVNRSSYYRYLDKQVKGLSEKERQVVDVFKEHKRRYGSRRISKELDNKGVKVGRGRVRKIMAREGLVAIQPKSFVPRTTMANPLHRRSENLLLDRVFPSCPNSVWVGDITYLPLESGDWLYLAVWMDLYSRYIVGWEVDDNMRAGLVIKPFRKAVKARKPEKGLIVHSDGGGQYSDKEFRQLLESLTFKQSMTRKDNHYDNAFAESLFSRFKSELLEGGTFIDLEDAKTECFEYIEEYYNRKRLHSSLDYQIPEEFEKIYHLGRGEQ